MSRKSEKQINSYKTKVKKNYQLILIAFLLAILVLTTYRKSFDNDFVDWDDYTYVVENDLVRNTQETTLKDIFSTTVSLNYQPLTILSLRLNNNECKSCTEGISAAPFIKWNVIIHLLNTLLVFLLIYLLSKKTSSSRFSSLLYLEYTRCMLNLLPGSRSERMSFIHFSFYQG